MNVQVICASHKQLKALVERGHFREDLYHRLDVLSITLPPLRDRGRDKLLLADAFIAETCAQYGIPKRELTEDARQAILSYTWPGNVRELHNQIERIVLLENDDAITAEQFHFGGEANLPDGDRRSSVPPPSSRGSRPPPSNRAGTGRWRLSLPPTGFSLDELERQAILAALQRNRGNVSKTARYLRISRQKLIYRMRKHGIDGN